MPSKGQESDIIGRLWGKSVKHGECNLWLGKVVGHGYGEIWYKGKGVRINRLICHIFHGADLDDKSWVGAHKPECPHRNCWNPDHLYVTTQYQNVQDQIARGNFVDGSRNLNGGENFNKEKWLKSKRGEV